jgi:drug/metabolite transporter (DMT)-like permease
MQHPLATFVAALIAIQVGGTIAGTRMVIDQAGPGSLAVIRYSVGVLCLLGPVLLFAAWPRVRARDIAAICLLGVFQFGAVIVLLNISLIYITAARTALIFATSPLLTLLLAAAMRHERLTANKTIGVLVTIIGVTLALGEKAFTGAQRPDEWIGESAAVASALCSAACNVLCRPLVRRYSPLPVALIAMVTAVIALSVLAFFEGFFTTPPRLTTAGWAIMGAVGVSSGVFYYLWVWVMGRISATHVSVFLALSPITAALLGWVFLAEPITPGLLGGLIAVAAGLWLAFRPTPGEHDA